MNEPRRTKHMMSAIALLITMAVSACGGAQAERSTVSDDRAIEVAGQHMEGSVVRVEHQTQGDRAILEVVMRTNEGELRAVEVDAHTGRFIRVEDEDEDGEVDEAD